MAWSTSCESLLPSEATSALSVVASEGRDARRGRCGARAGLRGSRHVVAARAMGHAEPEHDQRQDDQLIPIGVTQPKLTVNSTTAATARATRCSRTSMVVLTRGRISCGTGT